MLLKNIGRKKMIKYYNNEDLNELVKEGITIVDFYADWCGPCKMLGSVLEKLDYNIVKINTDNYPELAREFAVMSIPTVLIYKDGKNVRKFIGFRSKEEIENIIKDI